MSLLSLPIEILYNIAEELARKDLISFHRTNRRLARILTPIIYGLALTYQIPRPNPRAEYGPVSVLHWAVVSRNELVLRRLLEKGADIEENTVWKYPGYYNVIHICEDERILKILLDNGANIRAVSEIFRYTPLHIAASHGNRKIAAMLLKAGIEVDIRSVNGMTPLHKAAENGNAGMARFLLSNGAKITAKDTRGYTALHLAASNGEYGVSKMLLNRGANAADENNRDHQTAYDKAPQYNNELRRLLNPDRDRLWRDPLF